MRATCFILLKTCFTGKALMPHIVILNIFLFFLLLERDHVSIIAHRISTFDYVTENRNKPKVKKKKWMKIMQIGHVCKLYSYIILRLDV